MTEKTLKGKFAKILTGQIIEIWKGQIPKILKGQITKNIELTNDDRTNNRNIEGTM